MRRAVGVVNTWDTRKGYGFIFNGDQTFFAHIADLIDRGTPPLVGDLVEFLPTSSERGPRAERVRRLPPTCGKCEAELHGLRCAECGFLVGTK